jgi:hypothetical protein
MVISVTRGGTDKSRSFWYENDNDWRAVNYSPQTDLVSDFTENHSLNVINVKQI